MSVVTVTAVFAAVTDPGDIGGPAWAG